MKHRRNRFLTGLASALITFATLSALAGPMHWQRRGPQHWHHHYQCGQSGDQPTQYQPINK